MPPDADLPPRASAAQTSRLVVVCATRASRAGFEQNALLAHSLPRRRTCSSSCTTTFTWTTGWRRSACTRRSRATTSSAWRATSTGSPGSSPGTSSRPDKSVWSSSTAPGASAVSYYGPSPRPVRLLDGLFLAARAGTLQRSGVRFDPALGFHFYDLDFCRAAEAAGLSLGTWPIALTHASTGASIRSPAWAQAAALYQRKWQEPAQAA